MLSDDRLYRKAQIFISLLFLSKSTRIARTTGGMIILMKNPGKRNSYTKNLRLKKIPTIAAQLRMSMTCGEVKLNA